MRKRGRRAQVYFAEAEFPRISPSHRADEQFRGGKRLFAFNREKDGGDADTECLRLIPTLNGADYYVDKQGEVWRMTQLIENTDAYLIAENRDMFEDAGRAFGLFIKRLEGFDASTLIEVIPDFHNTVKRYENLEKAVAEDKAGRAAGVSDLIDFARARRDKTGIITGALAKVKFRCASPITIPNSTTCSSTWRPKKPSA